MRSGALYANRARARVAGLAAAAMLAGVLSSMPATATAVVGEDLTGRSGPTIIGPADSATQAGGATANPLPYVVLSWDAVKGASSYRVQISPNGDWTNNKVPDMTTVGTVLEVPQTLPYASYFWRVRGESEDGTSTEWSSVRTFYRMWTNAVTITQQPTDSNPTFAWTPVTYASAYVLQLGPNGNFSPDKRKDCLVNHPSYTPYDSIGDEGETAGDCFTLKDLVNQEDADPDEDGVMSWSWRVRPLDGTHEDPLDADTSPRLTTGCDENNRNCGPWTWGGDFTYTPGGTATPAGSPTGLTVSCGGNCSDTPTLSWSPVTGARYYRVTIALDHLFLNSQRQVYVAGPSFTPRDSLLDNQAGLSYHWAVAACDAGDGSGDKSKFRCYEGTSVSGPTFKKRSNPVTLTFPDQSQVITRDQFTFRWENFLATGGAPRQEARGYRIQLAADPKFANKPWVKVVDHTQYTWTDLKLPDGKYYWRVQAIDQSDNQLTWSPTRVFIKDSNAPTGKLVAPLSLSGESLISFSEPVTNVTSGTVGLMEADTKRKVPGAVFVVDNKTAAFVPTVSLAANQQYVLWSDGVKDAANNPLAPSGAKVLTTNVLDSGAADIQGKWNVIANGAASGGRYIASSTKGAATQVHFSGQKLEIVGRTDPKGGQATVFVDGKARTTVSFYSAKPKAKVTLARIGNLAPGYHVVTVVVRGTKVKASKGKAVYVDAFRTATGLVEEKAGQVVQLWSARRATDAFGGNYETVEPLGLGGSKPAATFTAKGKRLTVVGCRTPDSGRMAVLVNGRTVATVDLYQSYTSCNKPLYAGTLSGGTSTVKLVATGTKRLQSRGARVSIDAVKVA